MSLVARPPIGPAWAARHPVQHTSFPAKSGVLVEVRTEIDAAAEEVAAAAGDPANFIEMFPAHEVRVLSQQGASQLVAVEMRQPWPVGVVRWNESVLRRAEDTGTLVVERHAQRGGYFRHMDAEWRVTPLPPVGSTPSRCQVVYRVAVELNRWAPTFMLRRGHTAGMVATVERLRQIVERITQAARP